MSSLTIATLGSQGEGVADFEGRKVFVPYTLPGERVNAGIDGERGTLVRVETASPNRIWSSACGADSAADVTRIRAKPF